MRKNIILQSDSYKVSHAKQYPPNTQTIYSYFESRGGKFDSIVFFGLQYYLKEYLQGVRVTYQDIEEAKEIYTQHFGNESLFNEQGWKKIIEEYGGKLPVRIKAVPEGTVVPVSNVLMTIENTDPDFYWLTNYLETMLVQVWYPSTVATYSREIKKNILNFLIETGSESPETDILFKLHDFGYRGSTTQESSAIGGAAHLINFLGTDTVSALQFIREYYNTKDVVGYSIPASEHSTITSWGKNREVDAFRNMLEQYPTGLVACVSDSYDIYNACWELWGTELREKILTRDGTLVVRPDSGDPSTVVLKIINILGDRFGYTTNKKGYKVLDPHIRIIQGDGINLDTITDILRTLKNNRWAVENVGYGSGGALLQKHDRDEQKFAFKCSYALINNQDVEVYKNPITDPGKMSKRGRLKLTKVDCNFDTQPEWSVMKDEMETVFENGEILKEYTFSEIRDRAKIKFDKFL